MKYRCALIAIFLALGIMVGCSAKTEIKDGKLLLEGDPNSYTIREFEYDGCQYIAFGAGNGIAITHKGNCKYCQQRNK